MGKEEVKSALEIAQLASQLTPQNRALVLNSIVTLLYAQESVKRLEETGSNGKEEE